MCIFILKKFNNMLTLFCENADWGFVNLLDKTNHLFSHMKKKLNLEELQLDSFVTSANVLINEQTPNIKGGEDKGFWDYTWYASTFVSTVYVSENVKSVINQNTWNQHLYNSPSNIYKASIAVSEGTIQFSQATVNMSTGLIGTPTPIQMNSRYTNDVCVA